VKTIPATTHDSRPVEIVSLKAPRVPTIVYDDTLVKTWLAHHGAQSVKGFIFGVARMPEGALP
jgi:hypothetical protein